MIQIDIPMPKTCYDCPCHDGEYGRCQITGNSYYDEMPRSCPCREIPSTRQECKKGKWIPTDNESFLQCSECGARIDIQEKFRSFFCYHCGADMRQAVEIAIQALSEQPERKTDNFENGLHDMFDHIWDCEIDHPVFQDTVGELMGAVIQLYKTTEPQRKTGKWITQEFGSWAECSECHELYDIPIACSNFCPNCGSYNGGQQENDSKNNDS